MASIFTDPSLARALGVTPHPSGRGRRGDPMSERQTDAEKELIGWVMAESEKCSGYLYPFHRQWYINIAAAIGAQSVQAETIARLLRVKVKTPTHRIRHQTNVIGGACRRLVGYLARSNPELEFLPSDLDNPLQIDYGKASSRFWEWHAYYDDYKRKELEASRWAVYTGMGILKATYDFHSGPTMEAADDEGNPLTDPETGEVIQRNGQPVRFQAGMPLTINVPSFHYIYGIEARMWDELNWNGEDGWFSFAQMDSFWPGCVKKFGLTPESQYQKNRGYYYRQISQAIGPSGIYSGMQSDTGVEGAQVTQVYIRPRLLDRNKYGREMYEQGAYAVICQRKLIHFEPNPFLSLPGTNPRSDWNPYTIFPCYSFPGRFIGQGLPENLIPLQEAINFINSRVREAQRTMGQPKWFIPEGSNVGRNSLGPEAGEHIRFNAAVGAPIAWSPVPMPAYIFNMLERYYSDIELVASQPPMMQGRAQGQIRSGLAVQSLQEQALTEFTPILAEFDFARSRHARQILLREIQFSEIPRKVQWRGPQGWEQELFFGKHISPDFTVRVIPGSSVPRSKALVMSELDRMIAWGALQPGMNPAHNELVARAMEYSIPPIYPDNEAENLSTARYCIARMLAGETVPVFPIDNHRIHANELARFMQSRKYKELAEKDPSLHERFMYKLGKHRFFMQMQAAGMDVPQPIPPFEDMAAVFPDGVSAVQQMAGGGGGGGPQGMGTPAGGMNPGATMPTGGNQSAGSFQGMQAPQGPGGMS